MQGKDFEMWEKNLNRMFWLGAGFVSLLGFNIVRKVLNQANTKHLARKTAVQPDIEACDRTPIDTPTVTASKRKTSIHAEARDSLNDKRDSQDLDAANSGRSKSGTPKSKSGQFDLSKNSVYTICFTGGPCAGRIQAI